MLDFLRIVPINKKDNVVEIVPKFVMKESQDLMIRGGDFYAIWNEGLGLWSTKEQDVIDLIDQELEAYTENYKKSFEGTVSTFYMWDASSGMIDSWHKYCQKQMRDNFNMLDEKLIFSNTETNKKDYASKRLTYPLEAGECPAYEKIISTLYSEGERHKLEWAIGSIVSGESKTLQKFLVLYGSAGTGKSTILNIIQQLFNGYCSSFDAKALGSANAQFALEPFRNNPLVAIQHDGDLSKIEDNTRLNSLVSHEVMSISEKFKSSYENRFKCFLFMGTNRPVKITDAKSGLLRRLIDVSPSGKKLGIREYNKLMKQVSFELGAIAYHCKEVFLEDPNAYDDYVPTSMMSASNDFYNFVVDSYSVFKKEDSTTAKVAWEMYKTYVEDSKMPYPFSQRIFKEELKNYFHDYQETYIGEDGNAIKGYYSGFKIDKFENDIREVKPKNKKSEDKSSSVQLIKFDAAESIFDKERSDCFAQYASSKGTPMLKWDDVKTRLKDIGTRKLHYVKVPENHIVIDFDIRDESGNKCLEKNIEEASKWPATYAEFSQSGNGVHLHYIYSGDVSKLSRIYDENIEVKVYTGKSSLRRKLTKCNDLPIATISSGLPLKGDEKLVNWEGIKNEKMLRIMIKKNLNKEYHANTKPSVDYIYELLEDAYSRGIPYDVSDLYNAVFAFAANSTNQSDYCMKKVDAMKFKSEETSTGGEDDSNEKPIVFYDVEVFSNLLLVNWKLQGEGKPVVRMINPSPKDIEGLLKYRLIGFNVRRYDNHILYGRLIGYTNEQIYDLSQRIISGDKNAFFREAYNLSYTDVYDFAAKKMSLKKWEIELGLKHLELGLPWDKPVPEDQWEKVAEYCDWDVKSTEAVFNHLHADFIARQILADLAGMTVNDTTNSLTTRIIFGKERKPKLVYTDLADTFSGYEFKYSDEDGKFHNMYRGTDVGFGGYIISNPGVYGNVALLDIASLHPHSIKAMNCFGEYTKNFTDIMDARIAIKHKDYETARTMLNGRLAPYLEDESTAKDLAQALKIAINSVYGLTAASFDNPFRDNRNKNNIVALRGALFMRTLQDEIESRGFKIVAIKTDSIKIADATKEIVDFCIDFAKRYSYTFEVEAVYDRICQINDADYIAKYKDSEWCLETYGYIPGDNAKHPGEWTATGKQFQVPYTFKKLFSKEPIEFADMCETKEVKSAIYLDMNENRDSRLLERQDEINNLQHEWCYILDTNINTPKDDPIFKYCDELERKIKKMRKELDEDISNSGGRNLVFVGKVGNFCPIKPGCGGGELVRENTDKEGNIKYDSVVGAKGYRWLESEMVRTLGKEDDIDRSYYDKLVNDAVDNISKYGDFEWFVSDDPYIGPEYDERGAPIYHVTDDDTCPFDVR